MAKRNARLNDPLHDAKASFQEELKLDPVKAERFERLKARTRAFERQRYLLDKTKRLRLAGEKQVAQGPSDAPPPR